LPKDTDWKKKHITGIVTSDLTIEKIKTSPDLVQTLEANMVSYFNSCSLVPETDSQDTSQGRKGAERGWPRTSSIA